MASFAEYPSHTMAYTSHDFPLYQYALNDEQSYIPSTSYPGHDYLDSTSFDSYQPQQAFDQPLHDHYTFNPEQHHYQTEKHGYHASGSNYSPANSISHSFDNQQAPVLSSTSDSGASVQSTISSAMGSPSLQPQPSNEWSHHALSLMPNIVHNDGTHNVFATTNFDLDTIPVTDKGCVDPALIQPYSPTQFTDAQFPNVPAIQSPHNPIYAQPPSPAASSRSQRPSIRNAPGSASPYMHNHSWQPYPAFPNSRRQSVSSIRSRHSQGSLSSDDSNKGLCPIAACGRQFKDLKAHMLTHQNERPEKCPIPTCEYHTKGFARKYDKNRHTLTHYKGTMVCGFCPGSGSAAEKSFNRADVFKRHLTSVHNCDQPPPHARRKSPIAGNAKRVGYNLEAAGMCSTCGVTFPNAQDFYEHLDDCVLRVVQQAEPSEAVNQKLLSSVADDAEVQETLEKNGLPSSIDYNGPTSFDDEEEEVDEEDSNDATYGTRSNKSGKGAIRPRKQLTRGVSGQHIGSSHVSSSGAVSKPGKKGLTYSKSGVPLAGSATAGKGSKRRKNYPLSWGAAPEKMRMKKRVLCVYDGQRRLWKDDMMLDGDNEVRIPLHGVGDGRSWITDLDFQTVRRADALHNATEEEKGAEEDIERLMQQ